MTVQLFPKKERNTMETTENKQMSSNISRVGAKPTVVAKAEAEIFIKNCAAVVKYMPFAAFLQKSVSKIVKNGLIELLELLDRISYYRWSWRATKNTQKSEATALETRGTNTKCR